MAVRELFDGLATEYVEERDRQPTFLAQKRVALAMLEGARGSVLDLGCGPAVMAGDLVRRGWRVTGVDSSLEMLRHGLRRVAEEGLAGRCRLEPGDAESLRFPDASFDAVLCMGVLEYLPSYARALGEMRRVLRPGGVAVLSVPNRLAPTHLVGAAVRGLKRAAGRRIPYVPNRCVPVLLEQALAEAGFGVLARRRCGAQFMAKLAPARP